jgi:hypothetical protein
MRTARLPAACAALLVFGGCAHQIPHATFPDVPPHGDDRAPAAVGAELAGSVDAVVEGGWNLGRRDAVVARAHALGLREHTTTEWIDWFSLQENVVIDLPGETDELVIVVAHYDKTDINPLVLPSLLLNGLLDPLVNWSFLSEGAIDNATGVAVALALARAARERPFRRALRVLLVGAEESGLRGSRAHAARLTRDEWRRLAFVVNIDGVGIEGSGGCVTGNVSDPYLVQRTRRVARSIDVPLGVGDMPPIGASDYASFQDVGFVPDFLRSLLFNLPGALLPQRSYFALPARASVLNFMSCEPIDVRDLASSLTLLPTGSFHGPRDHRGRVDVAGLYDLYAIVVALLRDTDRDLLEPPPPASGPADNDGPER